MDSTKQNSGQFLSNVNVKSVRYYNLPWENSAFRLCGSRKLDRRYGVSPGPTLFENTPEYVKQNS